MKEETPLPAGSSLRSRLLRGALWSILGALLSRGLSLVSIIIAARVMGRESFGELGIIQATVGLFHVFAGFGMALTAIKHVAELRQKDPVRAGRIIVLSGVVTVTLSAIAAAVLILLAGYLASSALAAPHLARPLRISAALLFFGVLSVAQSGVLSGFEAFRAIAVVNFIAGVVAFPLVVVGVHVWGLEGALWGLVASAALNWVIGHAALRAEARRWGVPLSLRGWRKEQGVLWRFSLPAALAGFMVPPVHLICSAMLVNQPEGYGQMGIYTAGTQLRMAMLFLPAHIGAAVFPVLSSLHGEKDKRRYKKVLWFNTAVNVGVTLPAFLLISLFASWIMKIHGSGFEEGRVVLILLAAATCLMSLSDSVGKAIVSSGRVWSNFFNNTLWAIVLVTLAIPLVRRGATGLALAMLIAYSVHLLVGVVYLRFVMFRRDGPLTGDEEPRV